MTNDNRIHRSGAAAGRPNVGGDAVTKSVLLAAVLLCVAAIIDRTLLAIGRPAPGILTVAVGLGVIGLLFSLAMAVTP